MSTASVTLLEKTYKVLFPKGIGFYLDDESPLIRWTPKSNDFGAWKWWLVYQINAVRGGTDFTTALANRNVATQRRMELTRSQDHVIQSVACEAIRASKKDEWALISAVENAMKCAGQEMAMSIESLLTGDGGGSRGKIAVGGITNAVITLADKSRIVLFQPGMRIDLSVDNGVTAAAGVRSVAVGQSNEILSVDVSAGTITMSANITTIWPAPAAAGDFIFRESDYDAQAKRVLQGFFAWIPPTAPTAGDSFFGVDRSIHPTALAGTRITGGGANVFDVVKEACALNRRNRGKANALWVNPMKFGELDLFVTSKQYFSQEDNPMVGVSGMRIATPSGPIEVMESTAIPEGVGLLTRRESWELRSLDGFPHVVDDDGLTWHLEQSADAMQIRHRYFAQLGCIEPKDNTYIAF